MNVSALMWGVLFGSLGVGFFVYGKKQQAVIPMLSGIGLLLCPYLITNVVMLVLVGFFFAVLPFVVRS